MFMPLTATVTVCALATALEAVAVTVIAVCACSLAEVVDNESVTVGRADAASGVSATPRNAVLAPETTSDVGVPENAPL